MSLIIDLIIIIAAVSAIYLGIVRGFVKSVMGFASVLIAIAAIYFFTAPVAAWLNDAFVGDWVSGIVDDALVGIVSAGSDKLELGKIFTDRPEALVSIAEQFGCDLDELAAYYAESLANAADPFALEALAEKIAAPAADALSVALSALAIFVVSLIVLKLITLILDLICHLPVLDKLNTFLGMLFGIGSAIVTSWVIANLAVGLISALESINQDMFNQTVITGSVILRFFHENSLILF